ncbi:MAG TPA: hypothetical protein VL379_10450 [Pseudomonadales bacterium]|nr:hypothetical protein [Pseudomonadales bacterium]
MIERRRVDVDKLGHVTGIDVAGAPGGRSEIDLDRQLLRYGAQRVRCNPIPLAFEPTLHHEFVEFEQFVDLLSGGNQLRHERKHQRTRREVAHRCNERFRLAPVLPAVPGNAALQVLVDLAFGERRQVDRLERILAENRIVVRDELRCAGDDRAFEVGTRRHDFLQSPLAVLHRAPVFIEGVEERDGFALRLRLLQLAQRIGSLERRQHNRYPLTGAPLPVTVEVVQQKRCFAHPHIAEQQVAPARATRKAEQFIHVRRQREGGLSWGARQRTVGFDIGFSDASDGVGVERNRVEFAFGFELARSHARNMNPFAAKIKLGGALSHREHAADLERHHRPSRRGNDRGAPLPTPLNAVGGRGKPTNIR